MHNITLNVRKSDNVNVMDSGYHWLLP